MGKPVAIPMGIAFAFPDVCLTPTPGGTVPIPYPNIAQLSQASSKTDLSGREVKCGGNYILLQDAEIATSTGDEPGTAGGVKSGTIKGKCMLVGASSTVLYGPDSKGLVRFMDQTTQNNENAAGVVLSAFPTVFAGG